MGVASSMLSMVRIYVFLSPSLSLYLSIYLWVEGIPISFQMVVAIHISSLSISIM